MKVGPRFNPEEWLDRGEEYLNSARTLCDASGSKPVIANDAWIASEDSLKALGTAYPKRGNHDLGKVLGFLQSNGRITSQEISQIAPALAAVTGSHDYGATKYPSNDPNYWESRTPKEIRDAVNGAGQIHAFVRVKLHL